MQPIKRLPVLQFNFAHIVTLKADRNLVLLKSIILCIIASVLWSCSNSTKMDSKEVSSSKSEEVKTLSQFDKFKGQHVHLLDWTFFANAQEAKEYRSAYSIEPHYRLIGRTITGDVLAINQGVLVQIDHESPVPESDFEISEDLNLVVQIIDESLLIQDDIDSEDLQKLERMKVEVQTLKEAAPENMKFNFEIILEEIDTEIYLLTD